MSKRPRPGFSLPRSGAKCSLRTRRDRGRGPSEPTLASGPSSGARSEDVEDPRCLSRSTFNTRSSPRVPADAGETGAGSSCSPHIRPSRSWLPRLRLRAAAATRGPNRTCAAPRTRVARTTRTGTRHPIHVASWSPVVAKELPHGFRTRRSEPFRPERETPTARFLLCGRHDGRMFPGRRQAIQSTRRHPDRSTVAPDRRASRP